MNRENIKKVTNQAIEQLVEALNAGYSEGLTRYLGAVAKFRAYSFLNVLLILKQCPNAGRVAGYRTWQSLGRQVKKGEKGIMILAPMFRKTEGKKDETDKSERVQPGIWFPRGLCVGRTADGWYRITSDWMRYG
jgi:antirestriction protein ArdC